MLQSDLTNDEVYKYMQKYMADIVGKQKHSSMIRMEKVPCFYTLYSKIFLSVVKKTDLWKSSQKHDKNSFDVTMTNVFGIQLV